MIGFLPQLGLAAVLLLGGESVIHAHLSLGQFTEFYLYLNMLIAPMRSLGVTLDLAQRATASGARVFQLLDRAPRLTAPPQAPPLPPGNGHVQLRDVTLRYDDFDDWGAAYAHAREQSLPSPAHIPPARPRARPTAGRMRSRSPTAGGRRRRRARCCATSISTCPPGARSRWSGPPARARPASCR